MPDSMSSSPLVAALDPRVDEQVVQDQMQQTNAPEAEPPVETPATDEVEAEEPVVKPDEPGPDQFSGARP
jgi:hypothetical protein